MNRVFHPGAVSAAPTSRAGFIGLWVLGCAMFLGACATPPPSTQPHEATWSGRLSVRVDSDPPQAFSAGFELRGTPQTGELQLTSPLGNTVASVQWSPQGAVLQQGQQVTRRSSLDQLSTELSGTPLPLTALFGWLQGQAGEDAHGWQADLSRQPEGRITARRSAPLPSAELRLVFQP